MSGAARRARGTDAVLLRGIPLEGSPRHLHAVVYDAYLKRYVHRALVLTDGGATVVIEPTVVTEAPPDPFPRPNAQVGSSDNLSDYPTNGLIRVGRVDMAANQQVITATTDGAGSSFVVLAVDPSATKLNNPVGIQLQTNGTTRETITDTAVSFSVPLTAQASTDLRVSAPSGQSLNLQYNGANKLQVGNAGVTLTGAGRGLVKTDGSSVLSVLANGASGKWLKSNGALSDPSWEDLTGFASATANYLVHDATGIPTNGRLLTQNAGRITKDTTTPGVFFIDLASGVASPGTYSLATVTVDTYGRVTGISSGSAAPVGASYLVLSNDGTLTNERALQLDTSDFDFTDNGANSTYVVHVKNRMAVGGTFTTVDNKTVTYNANGVITNVV